MAFHHRDPTTKEFKLSADKLYRRMDVLFAEADKCDLLCANCHAEHHHDERRARNSNPNA